MQTISRLMVLLRPYRWKIALALLCMVLASCGFLALPAIVKNSLGSALALGTKPMTIGLSLGLLGGVVVLAGAAYGSFLLMFEVAHQLTAELRRRYVEQMLRLPVEFHRDASAGDLIDRLIGSTGDIGWFIMYGLGSFLGVVLLLIGGTAMLFVMSWQLALLVTGASALMAIGLRSLNRRAHVLDRERTLASERLIGHLHELLLGIEIVKAFNAEGHEEQRFEQRQDRLLRAQKQEAAVVALTEPLLLGAGLATFLGVLVYSEHLLSTHELSLDRLTAFIMYMLMVLPNTRNLAMQLARWRHVGVAMDRLEETLSLPREPEMANATALPEPVRGEIEFCRVSYRYTDRELVVDDLCITIRPGERVGVVGESGAGKTTLFNLLLRFYQPQQGEIRIDGIDIQKLKRASLRDNIAFVPQDIILFDGTILENVRYGRPSASDAEIRAVCRAARTEEFIESMPQGYQTVVGARGLKLSGGQRQRLAIARALLKNAPILLLDEATSSLDAQTESQIRLAMDTAMQGRTTLIIAHRLATVAHLPRIIILSNGRILDDGPHEELLRRCVPYRAFVATQLIRDSSTVPASPVYAGT